MLISWLVEKTIKKVVVGLNKPVKLRFSDGVEIIIKIVEQKPQLFKPKNQEEFLISSNTLLAQAILGHKEGEQVKYIVDGKIQKVIILEIRSWSSRSIIP